jgi:hypothetical protein
LGYFKFKKMTPQTKKGLIITGVVAVLVSVTIKLIAKKPTANSDSTGGNTGDNTGGSTGDNTNRTNDTSIVGKVAIARANDIYVRKGAEEYSNIAYNNIIGVLSTGENAGTISASAIGSDGKLWYAVSRGSDYSCPYLTCGFHMAHNSGWVKSAESQLKVTEGLARVAHHRQRAMLDRIEASRIDADELGVRRERRPRTRREIFESCAYGDDDIGLGRQRVRRLGTRDTDRTAVAGVVGEQA